MVNQSADCGSNSSNDQYTPVPEPLSGTFWETYRGTYFIDTTAFLEIGSADGVPFLISYTGSLHPTYSLPIKTTKSTTHISSNP